MGDDLLLLLDQINTSSPMYLLWMTSGFTPFTGVPLCLDLYRDVSFFDSLHLAVLFFLLCEVETSIVLFLLFLLPAESIVPLYIVLRPG